MVRWHFGRDHHPVHRKLAQVLVTLAWPVAVLLHLWLVRQWFGPPEILRSESQVLSGAAIRHNVFPSEYYQYELWRPDRRENIDNYLYLKEGFRLFKVLNRRSQVDPIVDKLAFYGSARPMGSPTQKSWRHSLRLATHGFPFWAAPST